MEVGCTGRRDIGSSGLPHHGDMGTNTMFPGVNSGVSLVTFLHFYLQNDKQLWLGVRGCRSKPNSKGCPEAGPWSSKWEELVRCSKPSHIPHSVWLAERRRPVGVTSEGKSPYCQHWEWMGDTGDWGRVAGESSSGQKSMTRVGQRWKLGAGAGERGLIFGGMWRNSVTCLTVFIPVTQIDPQAQLWQQHAGAY